VRCCQRHRGNGGSGSVALVRGGSGALAAVPQVPPAPQLTHWCDLFASFPRDELEVLNHRRCNHSFEHGFHRCTTFCDGNVATRSASSLYTWHTFGSSQDDKPLQRCVQRPRWPSWRWRNRDRSPKTRLQAMQACCVTAICARMAATSPPTNHNRPTRVKTRRRPAPAAPRLQTRAASRAWLFPLDILAVQQHAAVAPITVPPAHSTAPTAH
jgi:hypothetical protein